jgi:predicted aldo/keto reductase-like oxidoreductase
MLFRTSGVEISECFAQYNAASMFDDKASAQVAYGFRAGADGGASRCTECMTCEDACPQHLPIPERLKEVAAYFGM